MTSMYWLQSQVHNTQIQSTKDVHLMSRKKSPHGEGNMYTRIVYIWKLLKEPQ